MDILAGSVPHASGLCTIVLEGLNRAVHRWRHPLALPRFALLSGLAWLWRRGNRARRWARLMAPQAGKAGGEGARSAAGRGAGGQTAGQDDRPPGHGNLSPDPLPRTGAEKDSDT